MIVIIGGGPAGRISAMRLARAKKEVILVEKNKIGGQCLHHGCMVICALNDVARAIRGCQRLNTLGIFSDSPQISFDTLIKEMQSIQQQIAQVLDEETCEAGVNITYGSEGRIVGDAIFIDGKKITAEAAIIATGSRPNIPNIEGIQTDGVFTPHTLAQMKRLPKHLAIIGGGIMAAEFAYAFAAFGSDVTIIARSIFLKNIDPFLRDIAKKELIGVTIRENAPISRISRSGTILTIEYGVPEKMTEINVDAILLASGLVPNSECATGLKIGDYGEIVVDDHMRTSARRIFAAGDVTGPPYLTPVARMGGLVAADNILGKNRTMNYQFIPQSIALTNDLAFCGSTSGKLASIAAPSPVGHGSFWMVPSKNTGFSRILVDPASGQIRGIQITAPGGSIIASHFATYLSKGFSVNDYEDSIEVHPSTDGILPLIRYMAEWLKGKNQHNIQ